jgi:hypothetical protein
VSLEVFPATIRDAVVITRALGVKFLWVDALCMIQDSRVDWEIKSPKMSEIHANSLITIIAANASLVTSGIFESRGTTTLSVQLPWLPREEVERDSRFMDGGTIMNRESVRVRIDRENIEYPTDEYLPHPKNSR